MAFYDARTSPVGLGLGPDAWRRHPIVAALARRRGFRIPASSLVAETALPARAIVNHGILRAWCPEITCVGSAEDIWTDPALFFCMRCGNAACGGMWRPVTLPPDLEALASRLSVYPSELQNWEPWGPERDIDFDAAEWLKHAGLTVDPEHGLTDNEVAGADDPEIWTPPFIAVTNAIIASVDCNAGYRGNLLYLRQFLSADPPAGNYWLQSSSTSAAAWVARATAVLAAIGYTPLNIAGGTMSGNLAFSDIIEGIILAGGTHIRDDNTPTVGHMQILAHNNRLVIFRQNASAQLADFNNGALTITGLLTSGALATSAITSSIMTIFSTIVIGGTATMNAINAGAITGSTGAFSAALSALSGAFTNAISAASASISGALSAASATISGALSAGSISSPSAAITDVSSTNVIATNVVQGSRLVSTVATGTAPLAVTSTTVVPNLKAANAAVADDSSLLQGNAPSAFSLAAHTHANAAKIVNIPYTGNGAASRVINVGIAPLFVVIQKLTAQGMVFGIGHDGVVLETVTPGAVLVGWGFGATSITVTGGYNTNAVSYRAIVIGT